MKFTEAQLEQAFISLLQEEQMTHLLGGNIRKAEFQGATQWSALRRSRCGLLICCRPPSEPHSLDILTAIVLLSLQLRFQSLT